MRNLKKFLALVLAMMMAFSLMLTANAATTNVVYPDDESVTEEFKDAVTVLSGMGVFKGRDNGNFAPGDTINRAETAAIIYRLMTADVTDAQAELYRNVAHPFTDVHPDDWYAGYIGFLWNAGIIKGQTATTFNPYGKVTGYEALAMILRAVGYDQNHEFEGTNWVVNVASISQQKGILRDVETANYGGPYLYSAARRDVVASLLFRTAAFVPQVIYTTAFSYTDTGMTGGPVGSVKNPTLGMQNFGLTLQTGIVVGNQATGELDTLIGASAKGIWTGSTPALTGVELTQNGSYYYYTSDGGTVGDGGDNPEAATTATAPNGNVTVAFNFGTGLDLFGHKVDTWYDCRTAYGSQDFDAVAGVTTPDGYSRTYAIIDKATLAKTVWADNLTENAAVGGKTSVYSAAVAKGFTDWNTTPGWESDRFCQIGANGDANAIQSRVGMYNVISNNGNKTVDVVISLNQEVATISQRNTTVKGGEYIYLDSGNSYFGGKVGIVAGTEHGGKLLDKLLAPGSDVTLGDLVIANEIVGTTPIANGANVIGLGAADTIDRDITGAATISDASGNQKFCRYETTKLEPSFTGTVSTYTLADKTDPTTKVMKVVLTDGKSYDLSGITGSNVNTTDFPWSFDTVYCHLVNGATILTGQNTYAGVTYDFYEDAVGRIIGVRVPNNYKFLYTTFADYEIGALGTGTIGYYVYGVDWDGNIVKDKRISSIEIPTDDGGSPASTDKFDDHTPNPSRSYPNATEPLAVGYNNLPVTLKDQGNAQTGVVGNQIRYGVNTRFEVDPDGNMSWYRVGWDYGQRFMGWWDASLGAPAASYTWTVTANDAANGFVRVYNNDQVNHAAPTGTSDNTDYLLTNETKFIVVTGSGTADLSVKIYTGLTELLNGGTSAEITYDYAHDGDNVYFITSAQRYGNVNTDDNHTVDTVIMSNTNLTQYTAQSLYFSEPGNTATGVKLAGDPGWYGTINQYKLYNNGKEAYYWVSDSRSTGNDTDANTANGTAKKGDFYQLTQIGEVNGQPIYKATCVVAANANYDETKRPTNATGSNVNQRYDYIMVNELSTAAIGNVSGANTVMKVTGATVTQAYGDNASAVYTAYPQGLNISDIQTLNNAVSMGKAGTSGDLYDVMVAIVYDGLTVSDIYVTNIAPHT